MEAFVEGIGERYLIGKANAVPHQLENLVKKQFTSAGDEKAQTAEASALPTGNKDEEIARLRQQLEDAKLGKHKSSPPSVAPSLKSAPKKKSLPAAVPEANIVKRSNRLVAEAKPKKKSGGSAKAVSEKKATREMKGLVPLSIHKPAPSVSSTSIPTHHPHDSHASAKRSDRRASTSTAHHNHPIIAKGGEARDKISPAHEDLESVSSSSSSLVASRKGAHSVSGSVRKAASTAPSAHAPSVASTRRGRSIGARSEIAPAASKAASIAASAHGGGSKRGHSVGHRSEIESRHSASVSGSKHPASVAGSRHTVSVIGKSRPMQEAPLLSDAEARECMEVEVESYRDEEPGLYVVEVEEDLRPMRTMGHIPDYAHVIRKTDSGYAPVHVRQIGREDVSSPKRANEKHAFEVERGQGRTLYRVS